MGEATSFSSSSFVNFRGDRESPAASSTISSHFSGLMNNRIHDRSRPSSSYENVVLESDYNVLLLQQSIDGYLFEPHALSHDPEKIRLPAGSLLYEDVHAKGQTEVVQRMATLRRHITHKDNCLAYDILNEGIFANVSQSHVMRITDTQALILMAVPQCERLSLYRDMPRMQFLESLKVGDEVKISLEPATGIDSMRSGRVDWIGEQPNRLGRFYGVSFPNDYDAHFSGMSAELDRHRPSHSHAKPHNRYEYIAPHHIFPPIHPHSVTNKNINSFNSHFDRAAPSRARVIPIERVGSRDSPKGGSTSGYPSSNSAAASSGPSHSHMHSSHSHTYYDREPFESAQYPRHSATRHDSSNVDYLTNNGAPQPRTGEEQFENELKDWNGGASLRRTRPEESEYQRFERNDTRDNRNDRNYESRIRERRISGGESVQQQQRRSRDSEPNHSSNSLNKETMLRSQSKGRITAADTTTQGNRSITQSDRQVSLKTISIDDPMMTQRLSVGDRCLWNGHSCTVRFIGLLKGHSSIYAGVEFDEKVGKGTGFFEGETVFRAADGHAGFVILSALEVLGQPKSIEKERQREREREREANAQKPSYLQDQDPLPTKSSIPSAPPDMRPENYMIHGLDIGSRVMVDYVGARRSGTVKWIGETMSDERDRIMACAVIKLDNDPQNPPPSGWRQVSEDKDLSIMFDSEPLCVLVPYNANTLRVIAGTSTGHSADDETRETGSSMPYPDGREEERIDFGIQDSGIISQKVLPTRNAMDLVGRMKGIQGHRNSCYMDSMLFAMFAQSTAYDHLLERSAKPDDIPQLGELQRILAYEIVYPLRRFHYVRADHVMKLRELLQQVLPQMKGLTTEEKDPEEIINEVFGKILKAPPAIKLVKDGKIDAMHICPIIVEEWSAGVATTQHLLERHLTAANVKFAEPPKTLIIQLPRYGQQKLFDKILPLESINITPLVYNATVKCGYCNDPATVHCPECFLCKRVFLSEVSFCKQCFLKHLEDSGCAEHSPLPYKSSSKKINNYKMRLTAVLCIETSHYVSFVRTLQGDWIFLDSMADREGYTLGYNVPVVRRCEDASRWLSHESWNRLKDADETRIRQLLGRGSLEADPLVCRLLSDSYFAFYEEEPNKTGITNSTSGNSLLSIFKKS